MNYAFDEISEFLAIKTDKEYIKKMEEKEGEENEKNSENTD